MKHDFKMELKMQGGDLPSCTTYTLEILMDSPTGTITLTRDGEHVTPPRTLPNDEALKSFGRTLGMLTAEMAKGTLTLG